MAFRITWTIQRNPSDDTTTVQYRNSTYVQPFHGADLPACFHRLIDLLIERLPIVERTDLQELEQRVQLLHTVLPRSASRFQ